LGRGRSVVVAVVRALDVYPVDTRRCVMEHRGTLSRRVAVGQAFERVIQHFVGVGHFSKPVRGMPKLLSVAALSSNTDGIIRDREFPCQADGLRHGHHDPRPPGHSRAPLGGTAAPPRQLRGQMPEEHIQALEGRVLVGKASLAPVQPLLRLHSPPWGTPALPNPLRSEGRLNEALRSVQSLTITRPTVPWPPGGPLYQSPQ
jgi:hypothetical protein